MDWTHSSGWWGRLDVIAVSDDVAYGDKQHVVDDNDVGHRFGLVVDHDFANERDDVDHHGGRPRVVDHHERWDADDGGPDQRNDVHGCQSGGQAHAGEAGQCC